MSGYTGPDRRHELGSPSRRLHEVTLKALERTPPRDAKPSFAVRQVKGVGGATVIEWDVTVPVCDEYPDAGTAYRAACNFADGFKQRYGERDTLVEDLKATVAQLPKGRK